jgi:hypothetical protein
LTQTGLEVLSREWQAILRLQDWDIKTLLVHHHELEENSVGSCQYDPALNCATIRILRPEEIEHPDDQDLEFSLVHELLHVKMGWIHNHHNPLKGAKFTAYEAFIESLSQVLVKLHRRRFLEGKKEATEEAMKLVKGRKR